MSKPKQPPERKEVYIPKKFFFFQKTDLKKLIKVFPVPWLVSFNYLKFKV